MLPAQRPRKPQARQLATQVVISSSDNAQLNRKRKNLDFIDTEYTTNRHCYKAPLRLRGGDGDGDDDEDTEMTDEATNSGDMGNTGGTKRGPPSPGSPNVGQTPKILKTAIKQPGEISDLLGWLEQTVVKEKEKKKIGVQIAENMMNKMKRLGTLVREVTHENSRLSGEIKGKEDAHATSLTVFISKLDLKNAETSGLRAELETLKARPEPSHGPSYASKAATAAPSASTRITTAKSKSRKAVDKDQLEKRRNAKSAPRFMIEIPKEMSVARAKTGVWETVKARISNPKAKTIVSGRALIIIPDDSKTLEVMRDMEQTIEIGPKKPRVLIYDVDSGIEKEELVNCLLAQNDQLGLTTDDIESMTPLHKLGQRDGDVVHWVVF